MSRITICNYLLQRLYEVGVRTLIGVPGDYNLEFLYTLEQFKKIEWVGTCNELNASYAADGFARLNGVSALLVTNGVGALSAINGVAGAYTEHVPVIVIGGSIPEISRNQHEFVHHTLCDFGSLKGTGQTFTNIFQEVCAAAVLLRHDNAAQEIDRAIVTCLREKKPVFINLPSDIGYLTIEAINAPLQLSEPTSDPQMFSSVVEVISKQLNSSLSPTLLIDMDVGRFNLRKEVVALAEKAQMKVVVRSTGKSLFDENSNLFYGVYGVEDSATDPVLLSDCLIAVGSRTVDLNSAVFEAVLPSGTIDIQFNWVTIGTDQYLGLNAREVLKAVTDQIAQKPKLEKIQPQQSQVSGSSPPSQVQSSSQVPSTSQVPPSRVSPLSQVSASQVPSLSQVSASSQTPSSSAASTSQNSHAPLRQANFWPLVQTFLRPGDVLVAETGSSLSALQAVLFPPNIDFIGQIIWGSIGYALPALLGTLLAAPSRRQILFVGDGSFQLTCQEISTMISHNLKPIIFLINNKGYLIERTILGKTLPANDVADWHYTDLPKVFAKDAKTQPLCLIVKTLAEVHQAFEQANNYQGLVFIEVRLPKFDALESLKEGGGLLANYIYGENGPQNNEGARLK